MEVAGIAVGIYQVLEAEIGIGREFLISKFMHMMLKILKSYDLIFPFGDAGRCCRLAATGEQNSGSQKAESGFHKVIPNL